VLGFTLLEICISVAIIAVLAALAVPNYIGYKEKARLNDTITEIKEMGYIIDLYAMENDTYPKDLKEVGLDDRKDEWGNKYKYFRMEWDAKGKLKKGARQDKNLHPLNTDYDLYSKGPDGDSKLPLTAQASRDDIVRGNNGAFIGWGKDY
jgi:general secretion pathway protein G